MTSRQTKTAQTKAHLFDCALTLFSQRGYAATSIRDIIQAAGVTQPTLYHHFEDKVDLFRELVEHYYGENLRQLKSAIESLPDCQSRLLAMVQSSFEFCNADPRVPCLLFQTYFGPSVEEIAGILDKLTTRRFRLVTETIRRGIESGDLVVADPEFLALSFCCLMDQPINIFSRKPRPSKFLTPELAHSLISIFLHGAGTKSAERN
jgi:TetR/AcrR family transcriptional regulator